MVETSECAIQIVDDEQLKLSSGEFKPLTSGQLLLKTRHKPDQRGLLAGADDDQDDDQDTDPERECFLSKFLAVSMTLLVCCFIYFVVLQRWVLKA
ncbi:hypothetical protein PRIC1_006008 [Phytophthora ramorum]|uniref:uncharacterized protein n=1 Tax=Phytophthora ramorum TaxID=164328 RepID=UPI00309CBADE|nr:hypothetical protein KRP23_13777 [Phytophthora ramorum]KAH7506528.1 hypothetical protein KRP22_4491 [Phytophthora ramorum]